MIISPPFLPKTGLTSNDADSTDPMMDAVDRFEMAHGIYPVAFDRRWHCGVHLAATDYTEPVRAIADGEVIAYRISKKAIPDGQKDEHGSTALNTNTGFVLLKHTTETGESRMLTFYSLYMHLLDIVEQNQLVPQPAPNQQKPRSSPTELAAWLLKVSPDDGEGGYGAQPGNGIKVYRKDMLGYWGACHGQPHLHFEIFMTKPDFDAYFGQTQLGHEQVVTPATTDCWGSSYYVIPPQQQFLSLPLGTNADRKLHGIDFEELQAGQNTDTLYVEAWFHKGTKFTRVWRDAGAAQLELLTAESIAEPAYEYDLYKRATALYPACPSDGYELLRFGRILSTPATLPDAARATWMRVAFAAGQEGYININRNAAILKLSDADFPFFRGWKKLSEGNGPFSADGMCDLDALKKIVKDAKEHQTPQEAAQTEEYQKEDALTRYVTTTDGVRERLRGFVCEAPSEWDSTHNKRRYQKLQESGEFYHGNEAGYAKFIKLLTSLQFWDHTGLPAGEKLWFFHPLEFIRHFRKCGWLSEAEVKRLFPPTALRPATHSRWVSEPVTPGHRTLTRFLPDLNKALRKFNVTTPLRLAAFYGNAMQETTWFNTMIENPTADTRYIPWVGHGFLQLTWPDNFIKYWRFQGRQIDQPLASRLHSAAEEAQRTRSNAALKAIDSQVPADMKDWRRSVGDSPSDAAESAAAYWAWSGAASFADLTPVIRRESKLVGNTSKPYYSCESFGQVAAAVNFGSSVAQTQRIARVNGIVSRYQAYSSALLVLVDHVNFPSAQGTPQEYPDQ
jgi:hypothetical protein